jgi:hemoglobin
MTDYESIGERGFQKVVGLFYARVLMDKELAGFFEGRSMISLREHQIQFLAYVTGGPEYKGRNVASAHRGLGIRESHFSKVAGHLIEALKAYATPQEIIDRIVASALGLKPQIVEQP